MAQRTVIIHAGDVKCGSTSIQQYIRPFQTPDPATGFWCPTFGDDASPQHGRLFRPESGHKHVGANTRAWVEIFDALKAETGWTTAVISSEAFFRRGPASLQAAMSKSLAGSDISVKILTYVRPHHAFFASWVGQRYKMGINVDSMKAQVQYARARGHLSLADRLQNWADQLGRENTIFRPFVRDLMAEGDVVADFRAALDGVGIATPEPREKMPANVTPGMRELVFLRELNRILMQAPKPFQRHLLREAREAFADMLDGTAKVALGPGTTRQITRLYRSDAEALDRDWFDTPCFCAAMDAYTPGAADEWLLEDHFEGAELDLIRRYNKMLASALEVGEQVNPEAARPSTDEGAGDRKHTGRKQQSGSRAAG